MPSSTDSAPTLDLSSSMPVVLSDESIQKIVAALPAELKQKVIDVKGPVWKKVLWWILGILGVLSVFLLIGWILSGKVNPVAAANKNIEKAKEGMAQNDTDARNTTLEAGLRAQAHMEEIKSVVNNPNRDAKLADMERISKGIFAEVNK